MKRVLLTGIGGFIGAHCLDYFLSKTDWQIIGLDSFRHKGTYSRLDEVAKLHSDFKDRVTIFNHDLSVPLDRQLENKILNKQITWTEITQNKIDYIINFASDSAVERSATNPVECLRNNYDLVVNMLELARRIQPDIFFQISTDEVYGDAKEGQHKEWDAIVPSNPYSASKAAQEAVAIAYWRTFDVPVVITNTVNNIGEWQDSEKFLPKIIETVVSGKSMPIYADDEKNIGSRFYLHTKNHADAILFLTQFKPAKYSEGAELPDRYNVSGDKEMNNLEFAKLVAEFIGKPLRYELVPSETVRKGYDRRYALDDSKLRSMGWNPPINFYDGLKKCVEWTVYNAHWVV